jgi:hypothetical protein
MDSGGSLSLNRYSRVFILLSVTLALNACGPALTSGFDPIVTDTKTITITASPSPIATSNCPAPSFCMTPAAGCSYVQPVNDDGTCPLTCGNLVCDPTATAPAITAQPASLSAVAGTNATFAVTATGEAPLHYQWYFNDDQHPVSGATDSTLALSR